MSGTVADEEALPPAGDAYWDEVTADSMALLRRLRADHRRRRLGSAAYALYVLAVTMLIYGVPYGAAALQARPAVATASDAAVAGLAVPATLLLVLVAFVRDGAWRGPALVDPATSVWLLAAPVRAAALLRPRLVASMVGAGAVGALIGAVGGLVLRLLVGGSAASSVPAAAVAVGATALLGSASGGLIQVGAGVSGAAGTHRGVERIWRRPAGVLGGRRGVWAWAAPALLAAGSALVSVLPSGVITGVTWIAMWSGPWGWFAQPLVAAVPGAPAAARWWPVGVVLGAAWTAGAVWLALRRIGDIPARVLRARAQSVAAVTGALATLQPRRARLMVAAAQGWTPRRWGRLPTPRRRALLIVWRDALGLARAPARLLWALIWMVGGLWLASVATGVEQAGGGRAELGQRLGLGLVALIGGYLAAAQLVEPARIDADDPRRMRLTPLAAGRLAMQHAVLPGAVLLTACALWAEVAHLAGRPAGAGGARMLAVAMPALVGAALVSAYRGDVPVGLMFGGGSPMGDTGPAQVIAWYLRGPLVALVLLVPVALDLSISINVAWIAAGGLLWWAARRAEAVLRG